MKFELEIIIGERKEHQPENYVQSPPAPPIHHESNLLTTGAEVSLASNYYWTGNLDLAFSFSREYTRICSHINGGPTDKCPIYNNHICNKKLWLDIVFLG